MEALQTAMRKEQLHFEELTLQLQKYPDRNSYNHRKISAALCSTQRLLTNLCTKHMMCSGQVSKMLKKILKLNLSMLPRNLYCNLHLNKQKPV